jgi:hypothetical protein
VSAYRLAIYLITTIYILVQPTRRLEVGDYGSLLILPPP